MKYQVSVSFTVVADDLWDLLTAVREKVGLLPDVDNVSLSEKFDYPNLGAAQAVPISAASSGSLEASTPQEDSTTQEALSENDADKLAQDSMDRS